MNHEETRIQYHIVRYLHLRDLTVYHVPNERQSSAQAMGRLISIGLLPGAPDLVVHVGGGKILYLEVKAPKGRLSENQKRFAARCDRDGVPYHVVRSVEDTEKIIDLYVDK